MNILVLALVIVVFELAIPFWAWIALLPFAFALLVDKSCRRVTWRGACAGCLSWAGASLYLYLSSGRIIADRVAVMFGLGHDRGWLMVIATGLLGAIIAAMAAYSGAVFRDAMRKKGSVVKRSLVMKKQ